MLIGLGVITEKTGSADYLDAYWPGRYYGFMSAEEAKRPPSEW